MAARLHIRRVDPERPAAAAEAIAREIGAAAPHGRDVCVLTVPHGEPPGLAVAPWTTAGIRRAHEGAVVCAHTLALPHGGHANARGPGRPSRASSFVGDAVTLSWPGVARALRVPRAWLGRRLVLVTPCVMVARDRRVHLQQGAVATAFEALAHAAGAPMTGDRSGLGARIAAHVFAHVSVVVDASWALVLEATDGSAPVGLRRFATRRCVGVQAPCPTANGQAVRVQEIDAWLVRRLGLTTPGGVPVLAPVGDIDDPRWISVPAHPGALAEREISALWRGAGPSHGPRAALGRPHHPDALERAWEAWTERRS